MLLDLSDQEIKVKGFTGKLSSEKILQQLETFVMPGGKFEVSIHRAQIMSIYEKYKSMIAKIKTQGEILTNS